MYGSNINKEKVNTVHCNMLLFFQVVSYFDTITNVAHSSSGMCSTLHVWYAGSMHSESSEIFSINNVKLTLYWEYK